MQPKFPSMARKQRTSPKGPPPEAKRWLEEYRRGKHQGRTPTPEHHKSIWDTTYIPDRYTPATPEVIAESEAGLGIVIPALMREQLLIQNGGCLLECEQYPFKDDSVHWTNATVDGISRVQSWELASDDNWFESVEDVQGLQLLVIIAAHSESQLCLDYRRPGGSGMPAVTFVDVSRHPTEVRVIAKTVDEFIHALVSSRLASENA